MKSNTNLLILNSIDEIVHSFRAGEGKKAYKDIEKFIGLMVDFASKQENCGNTGIVIHMNSFLGELLNAISHKDTVYICDILKYGIRPQIASVH